jgi:hypothetical protein
MIKHEEARTSGRLAETLLGRYAAELHDHTNVLLSKTYLRRDARFAALSGLTRILTILTSGLAWVAKLQSPIRHFAGGFRYVLQNLPAVRFDDTLTPFTLLDDRQKRAIAEFSHIVRLHIANS